MVTQPRALAANAAISLTLTLPDAIPNSAVPEYCGMAVSRETKRILELAITNRAYSTSSPSELVLGGSTASLEFTIRVLETEQAP